MNKFSIQDFLKDNTNLDKPFEYQILGGWLGKGLLINDNTPLWKHRRKQLTGAFHFKVIEDFLPILNEKSNILVQNLNNFVGKDSFDLSPLLFACSLDCIAGKAEKFCLILFSLQKKGDYCAIVYKN